MMKSRYASHSLCIAEGKLNFSRVDDKHNLGRADSAALRANRDTEMVPTFLKLPKEKQDALKNVAGYIDWRPL